MRNTFKKTTLSLALATGLIGSAAWSSDSGACPVDAYISSVCVMATPSYTSGIGGGGNGTFLLAAGQSILVNQNAALFALLGATYGGDGRTNFLLPDMRGRVLVGAGTYTDNFGTHNYAAGEKGGAVAVQLTAANLPAHVHALGAAATATVTGTFAATTSLANTVANLAGIPFTSSSSSLSIKALNGAAASGNPTTSSTLANLSALGTKIYGTGTPDTVMQAGTVVGTVSGTLSGTAPITGTATTTITGAPTVTMGGATGVAGSITPSAVATLPPYLAMYYFIATQGIFPMHP